MKRFLIQTVIFGMLIVASLATGELIVRSMENPYKIKQRYFLENPTGTQTVILGNSHSYFGIIPELLSGKAVNLANVSQTLRYDRMLLEHYAGNLDSLRTVILPLSYTSLYDVDLEDTDEWWLAINYRIYMGLKLHPVFSRYGAELSHIAVYNSKLATFFGLEDSNLSCDSLGHGTSYSLDRKYDGWEETGPEFARRHTMGLHPEMEAVNIAEIDRMADFCQERGARLVLVTMPEYESYRENVDASRLSRMLHVVDSISTSRGLTYLDYYADPRFGKDDFYDSDHLTSDLGATKFTRILAGDLSDDEHRVAVSSEPVALVNGFVVGFHHKFVAAESRNHHEHGRVGHVEVGEQ